LVCLEFDGRQSTGLPTKHVAKPGFRRHHQVATGKYWKHRMARHFTMDEGNGRDIFQAQKKLGKVVACAEFGGTARPVIGRAEIVDEFECAAFSGRQVAARFLMLLKRSLRDLLDTFFDFARNRILNRDKETVDPCFLAKKSLAIPPASHGVPG